MKRVLCFGDSNTWGFNASDGSRFSKDIRWTNKLNQLLGNDYIVINEGLNGRTAKSDDPIDPKRNAYKFVESILHQHMPIDLFIIMLGTNDTKSHFGLSSYEIADNIIQVTNKVNEILNNNNTQDYKILVVSPPPLGALFDIDEDAQGAINKSLALGNELKEMVSTYNYGFLDFNGLVEMQAPDYMHLNKETHDDIAEIIYKKVIEL